MIKVIKYVTVKTMMVIQNQERDFFKFCGLLGIYELYCSIWTEQALEVVEFQRTRKNSSTYHSKFMYLATNTYSILKK